MPETIKPFTNYVCPVGGLSLGHSSLWTGAYAHPRERDGICMCGEPMVEDTPDGFRYRVEFESIDPHEAAEYEALRGPGVWRSLTDEQWERLSWHPVSREADTLAGVKDQAATLTEWADTHEQPIRNVRLLRSAVDAWEPVTEGAGSR